MSKLIMGECDCCGQAGRAYPVLDRLIRNRLETDWYDRVCDAVREQIAIDHEAAMEAREAGPISRSSMPMAAAHSWKSYDLAEGCRRISNESPIT